MSAIDDYDKQQELLTQQEEHVKIQAKVDAEDLKLFSIDLELCMRDKASRHIIRKILEWSGLTGIPTTNTERLHHAAGKRALGWELKEALDQLDKKIYPQLLLEGVEYEEALYKSK